MTRPPHVEKVQHEGLRFHVERRGHGPTVLLLHGFPDDLRLWSAVAPRLEVAGFHVIALDQRGCGASDAPAGLQHYHIDRLVGDAAGVLKALGSHPPVHVLGHDWGAVVTWCLSITRPEIVRLRAPRAECPAAARRRRRPAQRPMRQASQAIVLPC